MRWPRRRGADATRPTAEVEPAGLGPRARDIDDEGESGIGAVRDVLATGLQTDAHQPRLGRRLMAGRHSGPVRGHRDAGSAGLRVILGECVDELLGPHRARIGPATVEDLPTGVRVGGGVDVQAEGGLWFLAWVDGAVAGSTG